MIPVNLDEQWTNLFNVQEWVMQYSAIPPQWFETIFKYFIQADFPSLKQPDSKLYPQFVDFKWRKNVCV